MSDLKKKSEKPKKQTKVVRELKMKKTIRPMEKRGDEIVSSIKKHKIEKRGDEIVSSIKKHKESK